MTVTVARPMLPPDLRRRIVSTAERLIALLDATMPDSDLEDDGEAGPLVALADMLPADSQDSEPSLGAPYPTPTTGCRWSGGACYGDREGPDGDAEPSLAAPERHPMIPHPSMHPPDVYVDGRQSQTAWADGGNTDEREEENEHAAEDEKGEPLLGATNTLNHVHGWADSLSCDEDEPALGWSNERGHPETATRGYDAERRSSA